MNTINRKDYNKVKGIYFIKNKIDSKIYVGSSTNLYGRNKTHKSLLINNKHNNHKLTSFVKDYGIDNLMFEVVEIVEKIGDLKNIEQKYIDNLKSVKYGFNLCSTANGNNIYSKETKLKISEKNKKRICSDKTRRRMSENCHWNNCLDTHPNAKLKNEDVIKIKKMLLCGYSQHDINKIYRVNFRTIWNIKSEHRWKSIIVTEDMITEDDIKNFKNNVDTKQTIRNDSKLSTNMIKHIRFLFNNKDNKKIINKKIREVYKLSYTNLSQIYLNKIYKDITAEYIEEEDKLFS